MKKEKDTFQFNAKEIPSSPGCYLFYDKKNTLLYVGKAKNLKKRVSSYFQKKDQSPKLEKLVKAITKIETRVVNSEMEALILENNLIKEFQPKFNILLRDDKNFLYLKITNEDFPKIQITRRIIRDGSFYFGPKTSAQKFRNTIQFCQKVFQIRTCKLQFDQKLDITSNPEKRKIPCLDHHINKCSGPCSGEINFSDYQKNVGTMKYFLRGHTKEVLKNLHEKMMGYAAEKNFEAASKMRDLIQSIETSTEKQTVQFNDQIDRDFIHFTRDKAQAFFVRLAFRNGKLLDQNEVELRAEENNPDESLLEQFLLQFYEKVDIPPKEIFISLKINTKEVLHFFHKNLFPNEKIDLLIPQKGEKKRILDMAEKNAKNMAEKKKIENLSQAETFSKSLPLLTEALDLKSPPQRMECFDISHLGGTHTVASQVVFIDGQPKTSEYRRFKIKTLPNGKIDDFASMQEVLTRRFKSLLVPFDKGESQIDKDLATTAEKQVSQNKQNRKNISLSSLPDLIIIDGGKGQLSSVIKAIKEFPFPESFNPQHQIIALAKQEEQIFKPGQKEAIELSFDSPALKLLQRIRDEAHRFAISYNRNLRKKSTTKSILDDIDGIGPTTKKKLLKAFGSISEIKKATDKNLLKIINTKQLQSLRNNL